MKNDAIKLELIEWLAKLEDKDLLLALHLIKQDSEKVDWALNLSAAQKKSLLKGIEDANNGRKITSREMRQKYGRQV